MEKYMKARAAVALAAAMLCGACAAEFAIQGEIDRVAAEGGGRVAVPPGEHLTDGPIRLRSNVELRLAKARKADRVENTKNVTVDGEVRK